jgi:hypothetical protein
MIKTQQEQSSYQINREHEKAVPDTLVSPFILVSLTSSSHLSASSNDRWQLLDPNGGRCQ